MDSPELHTWSDHLELANQFPSPVGISPGAPSMPEARPLESTHRSRYEPPPNPPKNWEIRKNNINPDHGFGFSVEPPEFFYGFPNGMRVSDVYEKDGKVVMAGSGVVSGRSLLRPVAVNYHYLQRTELPIYGGDGFVRLPVAEFKAGFQFDIVKGDRFHYELAVDREEFINGLNEAAEAEGEDLSTDAGDIPQWDGGADPEAMDEYLDEYQEWVNGYLDEKFGGLFALLIALLASEMDGLSAEDYVELEKRREGELIYKFDLPLSASIGTWDYADGGEFFKGRVGLVEAIRLGGKVSGTFIVGENVPFKPYVGFGLFLDLSLLSFYYWDYKYPGSFDLGVRLGQDIYTNFGDDSDNFGTTSAGPYLQVRF